MKHDNNPADVAIPLAPRTETLAHQIVERYAGKPLTYKKARELALRVAELAKISTSQMMTYGPDELARIARYEGIDVDLARRILVAAGAQCVDVDGLRTSWARTPNGDAVEAKPGRLTPAGIDLNKATAEIKRMLHAARDTMRNVGTDTKTIRFQINVSYYAEAWGFLRALELAGVGVIAPRLHDEALILPDWLRSLERAVLDEEHFGGSGECDWCLARYGKDDAGRRRS